jgi:hypothetical protein
MHKSVDFELGNLLENLCFEHSEADGTDNIANNFWEIIYMDEGKDLFSIVLIRGLLYFDDEHLLLS